MGETPPDDDRQLAHLQRLVTLGELTAEMMHELRQPLAAIRNFAEAALNRVREEENPRGDIEHALATIFVQAGRAQQLTRTANAFSKETDSARSMKFAELIEEILPLVEFELEQHEVELHTTLDDSLPELRVSVVEIQQILVNLLRNAIEAVAGCSPERRHVSLDARLKNDCAGDTGSVLITVSDQGIGISRQDRERIFERYFTTKDTGVGLGLAVSRRLVENHGGRLWAAPNEPHGTCFYVELPRKQEDRSVGAENA